MSKIKLRQSNNKNGKKLPEAIKKRVTRSSLPSLTMQKRCSFEAVSRRSKSSETLMKQNKRSITDLFFKGLEEDDLIGGQNNGPPATELEENPFIQPDIAKIQLKATNNVAPTKKTLPRKLLKGKSSILKQSQSFISPCKRPKNVTFEGRQQQSSDTSNDEDNVHIELNDNNRDTPGKKNRRKRDIKALEKTLSSGQLSSFDRKASATKMRKQLTVEERVDSLPTINPFEASGGSRYRKNQAEMDILYKVFKQNKGKMPPRKLRLVLAEQLKMKENQVYKWFWELKQKQEELEEIQPVTRDINSFSSIEKFEVFINKDLKQYRDQISLKGEELSGRKLSDEEMTTAIKLYIQSAKREECEIVAAEIGFDIDQASIQAINDGDSYQQIIRVVQGNSRAVSHQSSFRMRPRQQRGSQRSLLQQQLSSAQGSRRSLLNSNTEQIPQLQPNVLSALNDMGQNKKQFLVQATCSFGNKIRNGETQNQENENKNGLPKMAAVQSRKSSSDSFGSDNSSQYNVDVPMKTIATNLQNMKQNLPTKMILETSLFNTIPVVDEINDLSKPQTNQEHMMDVSLLRRGFRDFTSNGAVGKQVLPSTRQLQQQRNDSQFSLLSILPNQIQGMNETAALKTAPKLLMAPDFSQMGGGMGRRTSSRVQQMRQNNFKRSDSPDLSLGQPSDPKVSPFNQQQNLMSARFADQASFQKSFNSPNKLPLSSVRLQKPGLWPSAASLMAQSNPFAKIGQTTDHANIYDFVPSVPKEMKPDNSIQDMFRSKRTNM